MGEREPFLRRWSRRKAELRNGFPAEASEQQPAAVDTDETVDLSALPDIEELNAVSDFAAFMQPGVPNVLRTLALRKLWILDPEFSRIDGLLDYNEDYGAASRTERLVTTAWRIGKGMPTPEVEEAEESGADELEERAGEDASPEVAVDPDTPKGQGA